jgi:integrase
MSAGEAACCAMSAWACHGRHLEAIDTSKGPAGAERGGGVAKRKCIAPHTLRHAFATELLSAAANLRQIQELLGRTHPDPAQRYTA